MNDNTNTTNRTALDDLVDVLNDNTKKYIEWRNNNQSEADDDLNEANIKTIKAFKVVYPNAKGWKAHEGIIPIPEKIYNFFMECVFDGNTDIIKRIEETQDSIEQLDILFDYAKQSEYTRAFLLTWS